MSEYRDFPLDTIAKSMERRALSGATCYQKWTCAGCGERVTANEPNTVYRTAKHDGRVTYSDSGVVETPGCDAVTDIESQGCNFMFVVAIQR